MDMQLMKSVDRYAGIPACAALKAYDLAAGGRRRGDPVRLGRAEASALSSGDAEIGVIKFWGMGSLILAAPLFYALRSSLPGARIHIITLAQNRDILELLGIADCEHFLELPESAPAIGLNILRFLKSLRTIGLHAVIDLEYLSRFSAMASYMTGAPIRVGFHSWDVWRGNLHTVGRAFNPYWHATLNFLNLHRALGLDADGPEPVRLKLTGNERERAERLLGEAGVDKGERVIAVNPNASTVALARRWPRRHFVELIDRIEEAGLGRVVLVGAPDEADYAESVKRETARPERTVNLAGKSSLRDLAGLLMRSELLVTNDSGPLHLASTLGARTVSFFGPETPQLFGPRGEGHTVLYAGIDCSPCINIYNAKTVRCMRREPECLTGITVGRAFEAVKSALGE